MQLDDDLRQELSTARNWARRLCELAGALRARPVADDVAAPARALAAALEAVVLDRHHAIEMHLLASKAAGGDLRALARARHLAREIGEPALAARIASLEARRSRAPELAAIEGLAWLDADQPDRAVRPLAAAARARPDDPVLIQALAAARREWSSARHEVDRLEAAAAAEGDDRAAARAYLQAARIERMLGGDRRRTLLEGALSRDPRDHAAYGLLEDELVRASDWNELLDLYRRRAEASAAHGERVETLRRGATRLSVSDRAPALAARLASRALAIAYERNARDIPGHLALVDLLVRHHRRARGLDKLVPLFDRGLAADLARDDAAGLAAIALDVAWNHLGAAALAHRYAEILRPRAPEHPLLADYEQGGGAALGQVAARASSPEAAATNELAELELLDLGEANTPGGGAPPAPGASEEPAGVEVVDLASWNTADPDAPGAGDALGVGEANATAAADLAPEPPGEPAPPPEAAPPSPIPPPDLPAAPEPEEMLELDPDDLEELDPENLGALADAAEATSADPEPPPASPEPPSPAAKPPPNPTPAAKPPPTSSPPLASPASLIPASARTALQNVVRMPSPPHGQGERRVADRVSVPADATVTLDVRVELGGGSLRAVTRDVSETGAFVVTDATLPRDAPIEVSIALPSPDEQRVTWHTLRAIVVREEPRVGYGVRFEDPGPAYRRDVSALIRSTAGR